LRLGLVGYNCATGIGEQNRQFAQFAGVRDWLVKPHGTKPTLPCDDVDVVVCRSGRRIERWLRRVDVVLFVETPFYRNLVPLCQSLGKRTVCVPNQEWFPGGGKGWPETVDQFLCPNAYAVRQLRDLVGDRARHFPQLIDTARFRFSQRRTVSRFLFINGNGGVRGRKGGRCIRELIQRWPEIPLTIASQVDASWPQGPNIKIVREVGDSVSLYQLGDVLLYPASIDGCGLQLLEAASCGLPAISTDGYPYREHPAIRRIAAKPDRHRMAPDRRITDWYWPESSSLEAHCRELIGSDISNESRAARQWAESRSWLNRADEFREAVLGGNV